MDKKNCYCEKHHIIPKSEGGSDEPDNLVNLTAREHYIAHLLLWKIYKDYKMACALAFMKSVFCRGNNKIKMNGRLFERIRLKTNELNSQIHKDHPNRYWLGKKFSNETKSKMSEKRKGRTPHKGLLNNDETKGKIRDSLNRFYCGLSPNDRKSIYGKSQRGTHWYNNCVENVKAVECPEGFVKGRLSWKKN